MNPAFSVVLFTTLAGTAQGLLLALFALDWAAKSRWLSALPSHNTFVVGAGLAAGLATLGLIASFTHLGRPERAWRAASQWRTSWLSREVIVLPGFIGLCLAYGYSHHVGSPMSVWLGALAAGAALLLFLCTGMIYVSIRFLREWATPLTPINFTLLGCASGFTLASAMATALEPLVLQFWATGAFLCTLLALIVRLSLWQRMRTLAPKSNLQTAIGIKHPKIKQTSQGFMGGSFNTKEFFHGRTPALLSALKRFCLVTAFGLPLGVLWLLVMQIQVALALLLAVLLLQWLGQLAERWLFFAQAQHPQNLYYQKMS